MTEEQITKNIAKNIAQLRKRKNITQSELAAKLNYSDKSVSKWERGEGLPDVFVLYKISEIFNVTLNDLIGEEVSAKDDEKTPSAKRVMILLLSMGLVFFVASLIFFAFKLIFPQWNRAWLAFIFAIPAACVIAIVFSKLWWGLPARFCSVSALVWSVAVSVFLSFKIEGIGFVFLAAGIFQLLVILWFVMLRR